MSADRITSGQWQEFRKELCSILTRNELDKGLSPLEMARARMKELAAAEAQASANTGYSHPGLERFQLGYEQGKQDALREVAEAIGWPSWLGLQALLDQMERTTPIPKLELEAEPAPAPEQTLQVKYAFDAEDGTESLVISLNDIEIDFGDGEHEDNTIARNFSDCHRIPDLVVAANALGLAGTKVSIVRTEEGV